MNRPESSPGELPDRWRTDARILRHWGHGDQAGILDICREEITAVLSDEESRDVRTLVTIWVEEARTLEEYGHPDEADTLRRAAETLRDASRAAREERARRSSTLEFPGREDEEEDGPAPGSRPDGERDASAQAGGAGDESPRTGGAGPDRPAGKPDVDDLWG